MKVNGSIKGDVSVQEGLSAQRDEVAAHGEKHVRKQEGDGSRRATGHDDPHHRCLRDTGSLSLQTIVCTQNRIMGSLQSSSQWGKQKDELNSQ